MLEKAVLSVLMRQPLLREEHPLDPELFHLHPHRTLYKLLLETGDGDLTRMVTLLHDRGELDKCGGPGAIADIYTYAPHGSHLENHLDLLRDRHARRIAIRACRDAELAAHDVSGDGSSPDFLDALGAPITAVFDTVAAAAPPVDTKALAREFLESFERKVAGIEAPMGLATGIAEIDARLRGLQAQHMGIISARPGGGKSTLATQIAAHLAASGSGVLYLMLERTEQSAFERAVIQHAGIHHSAITDPAGHARSQGHGHTRPDARTFIAIRQSISTLVEANLHIRKPPNRHLTTQCAEIRRYHRLHGVRIVILDQIGLVRGDRQRNDREEAELRRISNTLQELCHELRITLIVLSQVNEDGDTKGARAIEEDADWWLSIIQERDRKKQNYGEHQHILIAKDSHHGTTGERLPLVLDHGTLRFGYGFPKGDEEKARGRFR